MKLTPLVSGAAGLLLVTGCAGASPSDDSAALTVAAGFYPLQYVAEAVGGDDVNVIALAQPGVEPHDMELSPATVRELGAADLALYLGDFSPAVDDAIETTGVAAFDAADAVTLIPYGEHGHEDEHSEEAHAEDDHDHGAYDPHFWLDPTLLATYATAVGEQFAELDPDNADTYTANAEALVASLTELDETYTTGLAQCERRELVTAHEAFAYLAARYNLEQVAITGIDPESEPSPAQLLEIQDFVEEHGVTTIFTESLVNPAVAEAVATDTGATVEVLDPIESVTGDDDYDSVMARNLTELETALGCA